MRDRQQQKNGAQPGPLAPSVHSVTDATAIPFAQRLTCTITEACQAAGLGRTKLYELIGEGCLDTTTIGRRRLVIVRSLRSLLEASPLYHERVAMIQKMCSHDCTYPRNLSAIVCAQSLQLAYRMTCPVQPSTVTTNCSFPRATRI
jgi:hypothetical protein